MSVAQTYEDFIKLTSNIQQAYLFNHQGTKELKILDLIRPTIRKYQAYRTIVLKKEEAEDPTLKVDSQKVLEPFRSWSKSLEGVNHYINSKKREDRVFVLIEGEIEAFDLAEFAEEVYRQGQEFLENSKHTLDENCQIDLECNLQDLLSETARYKEEQELVVVSVINWNFIKS